MSTLVMDRRIAWDTARMREIEEAKQEYLKYRREGHAILKSDGTAMERFAAMAGEMLVKAEQTEGKNVLKILCETGDERITWDKENGRQAKEAKHKFEDYLAKGWKAYSVDSKGNKNRKITEFDVDAQEILMIPPTAKG